MARRENEWRNGNRASPSAAAHQVSFNKLGPQDAYAFWQGMKDHPRTLGTSFVAGFVEDVFGIRPKPVFGDKRLEAVRRLTVCFRHGLFDQLSVELTRARYAGITENQIAALRSRVGRSPLASG